MAGEQHASIDVHGAGQDGARLSLTWGTLLLGFSAVDQVDALAEAFADSQSAARRTPERLNPAILGAEIGDEASPSVTLRGSGTPLGNHPLFQLIDHPLEVTGMVATAGTVHR